MSDFELVTDPDTLASVIEQMRYELGADARLAVDTEFVRERSYAPRLELMQLATRAGAHVALIDLRALSGHDLEPLVGLLCDDRVLKIFHAFGQDLEIVKLALGCEIGPLWDTQIGAAFMGEGAQLGYAALVRQTLGHQVAKGQSMANWSARPLSASMLHYAAEDVRWLHELHEHQIEALDERGRIGWAEEQIARSASRALDILAPESLWQQVAKRGVMSGRRLAILQALARWRDDEARRIDRPRRSVLPDEVLVELARRPPERADDVLALRAMSRNIGPAWATQLVSVVARAQEGPPLEVSDEAAALSRVSEQEEILLSRINPVLRQVAEAYELPPALLATQHELRVFVQRRDAQHELLTGWRGALLREPLLALMAGA